MRAGIVAWCAGLALLLGGCDPARDFRYTREGIGVGLYWDGLPAATELQDVYLAHICAQAVSPTTRSISVATCEGLNLASRDWGLLVQAGMNDIDLRCDAYLSWLHDKRTSREPILRELAVLGGAAAAILKITEVGATPIALTAIAFGIAADSFTNYDLRILSGVDYTTVQSVVRGNRTQFRAKNLSLVIDNRPAAIYVLRNYLSICLPASIEMSINNTINVYHRGGPEALRTEQVGLRTPAATGGTAATVRGAPLRATDPIAPPVRVASLPSREDYKQIIADYDPKVDSISKVEPVLIKLCVPEAELRAIGERAKILIQVYQQAVGNNVTGMLSRRDIARLNNIEDCPSGRSNYYEANLMPKGVNSPDTIGLLNVALAAGRKLPVNVPVAVADVRDKIPEARTALAQKLQLQSPLLSKEFTSDLMKELVRLQLQ